MQSLWDDREAADAVAGWAAKGVGGDLALRTYSARLLGREPKLVLHGGGNTSVKTTARDLLGREVEVLCVKGSGWDLATIEPAGHPAVRLRPLLELEALDRLADEDMVNVQRQNLMDSAAPNPSVETLLHAFIPDKFVDHTHSTAILALADNGLRVPEDVSITGMDDIPEAAYLRPPLTTVRLGLEEEGRKTFRRLLTLMTGEETELRPTPAKVILRKSTSPPPS